MKKLFHLCLAFILTIALVGCSSTPTNDESEPTSSNTTDQNVLIAYFSMTGNTEEVAQDIQVETDGDLVEITRTEEYPSDYYDIAENEIINGEQPDITVSINSIEDYDVIFIGYPIWWEEAPAMINTFVHQFDFSGKTVVPICTSTSDGIEASLDVFDDIQDEATITGAMRVTNSTDITAWVDDVLGA